MFHFFQMELPAAGTAGLPHQNHETALCAFSFTALSIFDADLPVCLSFFHGPVVVTGGNADKVRS